MSNRLTLDAALSMPVADLAAQPADLLALLTQDLADAKASVASADSHIKAALERKYLDRAKAALLADDRDTGTIRLADDGVTVSVNLPKKVEWDQSVLATILDTMDADTARHYAKLEIKVDERKFTGAPPNIQALLTGARTVKVGKPVVTFGEVE